MTTVYGIKNCDTIKKARKWLEANDIAYSFHDYRVDGLTATQLETWCQTLGWENLINKRSTTWRNLDDAIKSSLTLETALTTMLEQPTLIKRPLLDHDNTLVLGFKSDNYETLFNS